MLVSGRRRPVILVLHVEVELLLLGPFRPDLLHKVVGGGGAAAGDGGRGHRYGNRRGSDGRGSRSSSVATLVQLVELLPVVRGGRRSGSKGRAVRGSGCDGDGLLLLHDGRGPLALLQVRELLLLDSHVNQGVKSVAAGLSVRSCRRGRRGRRRCWPMTRAAGLGDGDFRVGAVDLHLPVPQWRPGLGHDRLAGHDPSGSPLHYGRRRRPSLRRGSRRRRSSRSTKRRSRPSSRCRRRHPGVGGVLPVARHVECLSSPGLGRVEGARRRRHHSRVHPGITSCYPGIHSCCGRGCGCCCCRPARVVCGEPGIVPRVHGGDAEVSVVFNRDGSWV